MISELISRFSRNKEKFSEAESDMKIQRMVEQKQKSSNERELERFMEEERQKQIKSNLHAFREQRKEENRKSTILNAPNMFNHKNVILDDNASILGGENFFMKQGRL